MRKLSYISILFLLLITSVIPSIAQTLSKEQQKEIDSLNSTINNSTSHDTSIAAAYLRLSEILYVSNLDTIIPLCTKAQQIAEKALSTRLSAPVQHSLRQSLARAFNNIGYFHMNHGNIPLTLEYYQKSLKIREQNGDEMGMAISYINIGSVYKNQGNIPFALDYYHKSLKIGEQIGDKKGMANSYNNIGLIHHNQGDTALALDYYHKSLKIREQENDKKGMANSYNNIGAIHDSQGDTLLTLEYFRKSFKIREQIGDKRGMAISYNNIGGVYYNQGNIALALENYQKSLQIREQIGDKMGMAISHSLIGTLKLESGDLLFARKSGEKGLQLSRELGFPDQIERNARLLYRVAQKEGNYQEALEMRNLEIQMRDSLMAEEAIKFTATQQAKYKYEKTKAISDKEHEKKMAIAAEQKKKQKVITYATSGVLILVVVFLLFVFNRLKVTRKQKNIIESQKYLVEEKNKEITDSITYAKRIQNAILPADKTVKEYLPNNFVLYIPKDIIAGDFYWLEHKDDNLLFAAADCTGHGVPGAMVSVVCNNALNRTVREYGLTNPAEILNKTREIVVQEFEKSNEDVKDGMDIALCSLRFNVKGLKLNEPETAALLQYAGANNPLWIIRNHELIEVKPNKQPIGKVDDPQPFTTHTIELQKGDTIYVFTDGFADQFGGEKGKKMMYKPFKELLLSIKDKTMDEQKIVLEQHYENWKGSLEQVDDVCIIGVRI